MFPFTLDGGYLGEVRSADNPIKMNRMRAPFSGSVSNQNMKACFKSIQDGK